jgi:hypothetical protein
MLVENSICPPAPLGDPCETFEFADPDREVPGGELMVVDDVEVAIEVIVTVVPAPRTCVLPWPP